MGIGSKINALVANRQVKSLGPLDKFDKKEYKRLRLEKALKKCEHCGMRGSYKG